MIPKDLKYTKEHEWIKAEGDIATIGITAHAKEQLGDIVFVELPEVGRILKQMEVFGTVESVKAVSDLFSPVSGEVIEINSAVVDKPEYVGEEPYGKGWMIKLKIKDKNELGKLLSSAEYENMIV